MINIGSYLFPSLVVGKNRLLKVPLPIYFIYSIYKVIHIHTLKKLLMCVYACLYACIYVYVYIYVYVCMFMCMHKCLYVYTCLCIYVCSYVHVYSCLRICLCVYMCLCVCMYIDAHVCMFMCVCIIMSHISDLWSCHLLLYWSSPRRVEAFYLMFPLTL